MSLDGNAVCIPFLSANASAVVLVSLAAGSPASLVEGGVSVKIGYNHPISGQPANMNLVLPLTYSDMLRPLQISTPDFGNRWKVLAAEARHSMRSSCVSSAELMSRLQSLKIHPVQTIGVENIAAGCLVHGTSAPPSPILVHVKVGAGTLEILVRSSNKQLSANVLKHLSFFLQ